MSGHFTLWTAVGATVAATVVGTMLFVGLRQKFKRQYVEVGKISKLLIYPVKAFAAQEVETAECTKSGLKVGIIQDRMWSVINEKGLPVDQKDVPRFVFLHAQMKGDLMCIDGPDMDTLKLDVLERIPQGAEIVKCKVFSTVIDAVDCGEEAATWIQQFSGKPGLRLVQYVHGLKHRPSEMRGLCKLKAEKYPILFQGKQPYLILSEASVEDLNSRIEDKITCLNFRPNIVVDGCKPFDEDKWKYIKIGKTATFVKTLACDRCSKVTINTETGKSKNLEPLATLRKFRQAVEPERRAVYKYSPLFGMNYGLDVEGKVSVGDDVYAVYE